MSDTISIIAKVFFVAFITIVMLLGVYILHPPFAHACGQGDEQHGTCTIGHDCEDHEEKNSAPVITLIGNATTTITVGTVFTDPGATALDAEDGNITANIVIGGDVVSTTTPGTYVITYNVSDSQGLAAQQVTRTVIVNALPPANTAPIITLIGNATTTINIGDTFSDPGATAYDAENGDITSNIVIGGDVVSTSTPGTYVITYNVTDSNGLAAEEVTRTIIVQELPPPPAENTAPIITLIGNATVTLNVNDNFIDPGVTATDIEDGNITANIVVGGDAISTTTPGTYVITYNVVDSKGLAAQQVARTVIVNALPVDNGGSGGGGGGQTSGITYPLAANGPIIQASAPISASTSSAIPTTTTVPQQTAQCNYLLEYLKIGQNNNPVEVEKLQAFLKIKITGVFDETTFKAVSQFQKNYSSDVLEPWGLDDSTGYVYITTKKKVNEIYCQRAFPLTLAQEKEIAAYRNLLEQVRRETATTTTPSVQIPEVGILPAEGIKTVVLSPASTSDIFSKLNLAGLEAASSNALPPSSHKGLLIILIIILLIIGALIAYFSKEEKQKEPVLAEELWPEEILTEEETILEEMSISEETLLNDDYIFHF